MKRVIDFFFSLLVLVLILPVFLLIAIIIWFNYGYPVFFLQQRPGLNRKPFIIIKFRTMNETVDTDGNVLSDAERLTSFGMLLRSTSMDELPELWNVLKGDMSLVGPRPLLMEYLPLYSPEENRRHEVRPGITGWAQINGRNAVSWDEKFKMDIWYVDNQSFWLDIRILWLTILKVLSRENITAFGDATSPKFRGDTK